MRVEVSSGRTGAERGAREGLVTIIVDALRASATIASLLEHGATEVLVVEQVEEAREAKRRDPSVLLVGERGCLPCEGFDRGNSPLTACCPGLPGPVVFSSTNCSRCCVAAAGAPRVFLGTTVNAGAVLASAGPAARAAGERLLLVPAGFASDESRFNLEDHLACGLLLERLRERFPTAVAENDAARAALALYQRVGQKALPTAFARTDHGRFMVSLGLEEDARLCAKLDLYSAVPELREIRPLPNGGRGAVFRI